MRVNVPPIATSEQLAAAIIWLLSDDSTNVTCVVLADHWFASRGLFCWGPFPTGSVEPVPTANIRAVLAMFVGTVIGALILEMLGKRGIAISHQFDASCQATTPIRAPCEDGP